MQRSGGSHKNSERHREKATNETSGRMAGWFRPESDRGNSANTLSESTVEAKPIIPGCIYKLTINLWSTSNVFSEGTRSPS